MADAKTLYDEDFVAWSEEQAAALRSAAHGGSNRRLDWENLAEEIEDLAKRERRELHAQIRRILHHLLKLEYSSAVAPRASWCESVQDARDGVADVLKDSPSLRTGIGTAIAAERQRAVRKAIFDLQRHGELDPATLARIRATTYSEEQTLGDWFPPQPNAERA